MKRVSKRIAVSAVMTSCALFTLYGASIITEQADYGAIPVSWNENGKDMPLIIIDAGHGEST